LITIHCLVDNTAQHGSGLWGEHGASFAIETPEGWILFDTGQSGEVLLHNAALMGIHLDQFDAFVVSHAHYDHTGGFERFLKSAKPGIPLFANPSVFQERFSVKQGQPESIGLSLSRDRLSHCVELHLNAGPTEILPGVWTSGEITDRSEFEGRSQQHYIQDGGNWVPDPYQDDLSLVLEARDGVVIVCGCCHAGLLNTLAHIKRFFHKPILAIIGGTHLVSATSETLERAIDALKDQYQGETIKLYPNHCTGERAYLALANAFGEKVQPCPAGTVLRFE
jgi:7,8-dihydropterin-6-yl-methyl-4-(beta-D-ribofuranosyl)aminobenzene 5'-phosphate synthase